MTVLTKVYALGQQIWLDNLSRSLIKSGQLAALLDKGISGITSNPVILQKAFKEDAAYRAELNQLTQQNFTAKQCYETLAIADIQAACDVFEPLYRHSHGQAGFVSLELAPEWAHQVDGTIAEAKRLWSQIQRANVLIKVPATVAGIQALTELTAAGINVNLTLLFSTEQTMQACQAYARGLKRRIGQGLPISQVHAVASFFLSRIDTALDITLPAHLQGQTALALAKTLYADWQAWLNSNEMAALMKQNANPIKLLWASTATRNPAYSDIYYVENVIGAHTINTVPTATLAAFMDHGQAEISLTEHVDHARAVLSEIRNLGIDLEVLAKRLQDEGLLQFEEAFCTLLSSFTTFA